MVPTLIKCETPTRNTCAHYQQLQTHTQTIQVTKLTPQPHTHTHVHIQEEPILSEEEAACKRWLDSGLFACGLNEDSDACSHTHLFNAQEQSALDPLKQPLLSVHLSPHLDLLERVVMASVLHHVGALTSLLGGKDTQHPRLLGMCTRASHGARLVRRRLMELRNADNMTLKEGEEPRDWSVYTEPVIARCKLVMRTTPVRVHDEWRTGHSAFSEADDQRACDLVCLLYVS